jgi:cytochrome oxidase Cu insertion factor (SCO1/SenC/PrrC family)
MKRFSILAPFIIGLSLCSLACHRTAQFNGNSIGANGSNPSDGAKMGATSQSPAAPQTHLKIGDSAPDFTLTDTNGQPVKLGDFRGKKNVVLAFYVLAFTGG